MEKKRIYLDDVRTPIDKDWVVVRSYEEFVNKVNEIGLGNISLISLDHDLGDTAMAEWHRNVYHNYELNYNNYSLYQEVREKSEHIARIKMVNDVLSDDDNIDNYDGY